MRKVTQYAGQTLEASQMVPQSNACLHFLQQDQVCLYTSGPTKAAPRRGRIMHRAFVRLCLQHGYCMRRASTEAASDLQVYRL